MDCPDGSLCRITSSVKEISNPVLIVRVPDEDLLNFDNFPYKLITVGVDTNECEPSSEDEPSDEDEESKKFKLFLKNLETDKKPNIDKIPETDSYKIPETDGNKIPETDSSAAKESSSDSFHKKQYLKESRKSNYLRSNRRQRTYNKSKGGRSCNGSGSRRNYKNLSTKNSSSNDIFPWLHPAQIGTMQNGFQYPAPVGLLGSSPFSPGCHQFHSPNQNNVYSSGQNIWNNEYHHSSDYPRSGHAGNSSNYQRPPPDRPVSGMQNHRKNFQTGRIALRHQYGKNFGSWNRNQNERGRENSASAYYKCESYDYDSYRN